MSANQKTRSAFSPVTMIAMVLVGIVCMSGLTLLSAFEPELKSGNDGAAHALSKSSIGYRALPAFLEKAGLTPTFSRNGFDRGETVEATIVLTPPPGFEANEESEFGEEQAGVDFVGPIVIILPKWLASADEKHRGWVKLRERVASEDALNMLNKNLKTGTILTSTTTKVPRAVQLIYQSAIDNKIYDFGWTKPTKTIRELSGPQWEPILRGPNGGYLIAKHKTDYVFVVADPDILNNAGLETLGNARLAYTFFKELSEDGGPPIFDLTLHGFQKSPNLGRLALKPPLLGTTLCLLLALAIIGLQAAVRFVPPMEARRVIALGKRALADNTAGLIRMGRREHRMALPYAALIKRLVSRAIRAPTNLDPVALTATLDRVSALSGSDLRFSSLSEQAEAAATPEDLVRIAKDLHRWKQETTRERQ